METDLLQNLQDVGYSGALSDANELSKALKDGPKSVEFTKLVAWLAEELSAFGEVDDSVNAITTPEDSSHFLLELSSFLKELGCANQNLIGGTVNQRLSTKYDRLVLLDYLVTELMTSKILGSFKSDADQQMEVTINESDTARHLKNMLLALKFQKPPDNISAQMLFTKLTTKLKEVVAQAPPDLLDTPLFVGELSNDQWERLNELQEEFKNEYKTRREMLLKRLDVTVQSFLWSENIRSKEDQVNASYQQKRNIMSPEPSVCIADLLAARRDLAIVEKTSNATVRKNTRSQVNQVIIGAVPDRGGRPCDQQPPPPEMPSWQKDRVAGPNSSRGGRGGGGGGGGGGYRDHKDASKNFGQNQDRFQSQQQYQQQQPQYESRGDYRGHNQGGGEYHRGGGRGRVQGGWGGDRGTSGYQRGNSNRGRGRGGQHY
ncbi:protein FAM98A [Neodiprion lecontei]|uniref:Protein FAM98A n=1 Tax=Neodiprion lecontei TaxID=441921 RepID=A0A6J0B8A3_NEOLC|nr:protein FAM98A [Neodiprion lecontei]